IILFSTIIVFAASTSAKMIKKQKRKLEITVKRRTEQLEEKNNEIISQTDLLKQQKSILIKESNKLKLAMIEMQQLSLVAQRTDNSVLIMDKNGKFEWWNRGFTDLFNYNLEKYKDLPLKNSQNKIRPDIFREIRSYTIDKGIITYTNHEKYENGEEIWYQTTINPIVDNDDENKLVKFVIIDTNISEKKNNELIILNQNEINKLLRNKVNKTKSELELKEELLNRFQKNSKLNITYTKLLQHSFTHSNKKALSIFKDYFILDMPKENLSGDFLWAEEISNDETLVIFGDASGHKEQGTISSTIALIIIKEILLKSPKSDVNDILDMFVIKIKTIFSTFNNETNINYNIAALKINKTKKEIDFSSSRIPLFLLRNVSNNSFFRFNANKFNIDSGLTRKFDIMKIDYQKNDRFYLITDGWANQFGKLGIKKYTNNKIRDFLLSIQDVDLAAQKTQIQTEIIKWKASFSQLDDILVIGFEIE
ncbi:MAG: PAS domain-containing protein, partial [Bacteroidota bacterium]|nr:PAS domain-containing protein [Bacteroidota bacterium]